MKIRAHHLLCLQGFRGYGYDPEFTRNLARIADAVRTGPGLQLEIVEGCDDICAFCPHRKADACAKSPASDQEIREFDSTVLERTGLSAGTVMASGNLFRLVNGRVGQERERRDLCGDCEWVGVCLWIKGT